MERLFTLRPRRTVALVVVLVISIALGACGDSDDRSSVETSDRNAAASTPTGICLVNASGTPLEVTFKDNIYLDGKGPRTIPSTEPGVCAGTDDSTSATVRRTDGSSVMRLDIGRYGSGEYFDGRSRPAGLFYWMWCPPPTLGRDADLEMRSPSVGWFRSWPCGGFVITSKRAADVGSRIKMEVTIRPM